MRIKNFISFLFLFLCFGLLFYFAVQTRTGQIIDGAMLYTNIGYVDLKLFFYTILTDLTQYLVIVGFLLVFIIGVAKRKYADTIFLIFSIVVSNVATQLLKHYFLVRPDLNVSYVIKNSFPSGHVTLVISVMFALFLIVPFAYKRFLKWLGFFFICIFSFAVCIARWHRLSDVIGSILLCTGIFIFFIFFRRIFAGENEIFSNLQPSGLGYKKLGTSVKFPVFLLVIAFVLFSFIYSLYFSSLNEHILSSKDFVDLQKDTMFVVLCVLARFFTIVGSVSFSLKLLLKNILIKS